MAEATVAPPVTAVADGESRTRLWAWMRELLKKAQRGFASGATKVRVALTRAAGTTAATVGAAALQVGMATKTGWNAAAKVATGAIGLLAKGVINIGRGISWVVDKIGKGLGWLIGLFNKGAGEKVKETNARFTGWRQRILDRATANVEDAQFMARSAITSKTASAVGRTTAGVLGVATAVNLVTKGAVAAKVAGIAGVGKIAVAALGPVGLLITGAVAAVAGIGAWLFRRNEVDERAEQIFDEETKREVEKILKAEAKTEAPKAEAKAEPKVKITVEDATSEAPQEEPQAEEAAEPQAEETPVADPQVEEEVTITVDLTRENGHTKATFTGPKEAVEDIIADPAKVQEMTDAAMEAEIKAAGFKLKPNPSEVTKEVVEESLRQSGTTPAYNGHWSKVQFDKRRKALLSGSHAMPVKAEEPAA